jgi:hypothetical protein
MENSVVLREHDFIAWVKTQRQAPSEVPFLTAPGEQGDPLTGDGTGDQPQEGTTESGWASGVPDELIVAVSAVGACFGFPIGAAAGGVVAGFFGGLMGALAGAMLVLALGRVLKWVLGVLGLGVVVAVAYAILHSMRR